MSGHRPFFRALPLTHLVFCFFGNVKLIDNGPDFCKMKAYLTITSGVEKLGRLDLVLYDESVPRTVWNFRHFLQQGYLHSTFHRIIKGFMAQGGDFLNGDGTGSTSLYGNSFPDENFIHRHDRVGVLSMANSGKDTNGSQFFITFRPTPHLDGKHVVFGHVNMNSMESRSVLKALENIRTGSKDNPLAPVTIVDCGVVEDVNETVRPEDDNEIDLEEEEEEQDKIEATEVKEEESQVELPEEEEEEEPPKTKAEALKQRMRKLKLKMNQARQLNKQEVLKEGERLGSLEGAAKARKRQMIKDKKLRDADWKAKNAKALSVASAHGIDGKYLVEQADTSLVSPVRPYLSLFDFELNE